MDKYEYKLKTEQMLELMENGAYNKAAEVADAIDWKRVRNATILANVSDIYERNGEYQKSYEVLNIAYHRAESSRKVLYRLCTLAIKTGNVDEAIDYYDDFMQVAPKDPNQHILKYKILSARKAPVDGRIEALEEFKKAEYIEEWAYELAILYQEAGMTAECLEECDDLILWFSEGKYVFKAMELKMKYKPLTPSQQEKYDHRYEKIESETEEIPNLSEYQAKKVTQEEELERQNADVSPKGENAAEAMNLNDPRGLEEVEEPEEFEVPEASEGSEAPELGEGFEVPGLSGDPKALGLSEELEVLGLSEDQETPELSEEVPGLSEEVPGLSEEAGLSEEVPGLSEEVPGLSEEVPGLSEEVPGLSEEVPGLSEEVPGLSEEVPELLEESEGPPVVDEPTLKLTEKGIGRSMKLGEALKSLLQPKQEGQENKDADIEEEMPELKSAIEEIESVADLELVNEIAGNPENEGIHFDSDLEELKAEPLETMPEEMKLPEEKDSSEAGTYYGETEDFEDVSDELLEELEDIPAKDMADSERADDEEAEERMNFPYEGGAEFRDITDEALGELGELPNIEAVKMPEGESAGPPERELEELSADEPDELPRDELEEPPERELEESLIDESDEADESEGLPRDKLEELPSDDSEILLEDEAEEWVESDEEFLRDELDELEDDLEESNKEAYFGDKGNEEAKLTGNIKPEGIKPVDDQAEGQLSIEELLRGMGVGSAEEVEMEEKKKKAEPILPPDIQRLIDEIEGVLPEEQKQEAVQPTGRTVGESHKRAGDITRPIKTDDITEYLLAEGQNRDGLDEYINDLPEEIEEYDDRYEDSYEEDQDQHNLYSDAAEDYEDADVTEDRFDGQSEVLEEEYAGAHEEDEYAAEFGADGYGENGYAEGSVEDKYVDAYGEDEEEYDEDEDGDEYEEDKYADEEYEEEEYEDEHVESESEDGSEGIEYEGEPEEEEYTDTEYSDSTDEYPEEEYEEYDDEEYDAANGYEEEDYSDIEASFEEEFRPNPEHVKELDDREIPDEDNGMDILSATTPLSRKETAKLIATGKTAPLPMDEISDALSMTDTGFVVHGRYDLAAQSGIGTRAGLTEDQKKLFSYFVPVRGMSEQLVDVLEQDLNCTNRGGTSRTGNLLIIGNKGNGKTVLAVDVVKAIQKQRNIRQGKVAIVTGDSLNKKKISDIFDKLCGGALIIEKAAKMNEKTVARLNKAMERNTGDMMVVLEEQRKPLDRLLSSNREFRRKFTCRLEVPIFINDELVTFGQTYAQENGYRIDEMGILALYSRIDALQREDHAVTVAEVKEVMDEAMEHSQKASAKKLVKRVFGKNTDDADRIILSEKDFNI